MASPDAVILSGAFLYIFYYLEMAERKDARTPEKLFLNATRYPVFLKFNRWRPQTIGDHGPSRGFFGGVEVGWQF